MKIIIDIYSRKECKIIKKLPSVNTIAEAEQALQRYCKENGLQIVAIERCADSCWNYLSNGAEFDYTIE